VISAKFVRNADGEIVGFTVENHGESIVCAAVSMLVLNTVNSIYKFTKDKFTCDYDEKEGGFMSFSLTNPTTQTDGIKILLDAMHLGLTSAQAEYPGEIKIKEDLS
jgi:uncharacterized protein YsxB (DUF464 family)